MQVDAAPNQAVDAAAPAAGGDVSEEEVEVSRQHHK